MCDNVMMHVLQKKGDNKFLAKRELVHFNACISLKIPLAATALAPKHLFLHD